MDRSSGQKINKETQALNDTLEQLDLIEIYKVFQSKTADYIFFSNAHEHFPGLNTCWAKGKAFANLKYLKSCQASVLITML